MKRLHFCLYALLFILTPLSHARTIKIACVGDSITYGAAVENREKNNYPRVMGQMLGDGYAVKNFGVNAATLLKKGDKPYWNLKAFKDASNFQPNIVVIKLGTNDSKPHNWKLGAKAYEADLRAMVKHFMSLKSKPKVYLCTPAPVARDRWGINEKTVRTEVEPIIRKVAKDNKLTVIEVNKALKPHLKLFPDGIHPNAAGAKILAETVKKSVSLPTKEK